MDTDGRLSARDIGNVIGASAVEVNRLLKNQDFLFGGPGAYGLTMKGGEFGVQQFHDNGYGGVAYRQWETTHFHPSITEALVSTPERLAEVRVEISAQKLAQAESKARLQALQAGEGSTEIDPKKVLLAVACLAAIAGTSYGVYKGVRWYKCKKATHRDTKVGISV